MPKARRIEPAHGKNKEVKGKQILQNYEISEGNVLSTREIEVIQLFANGLTREQIGEKLFISKHTVQTHLRNARAKAGIVKPYENRSIVIWAIRKGLIT